LAAGDQRDWPPHDADRTYLNTGTWSDLIPWPALGSDADAKTFIDQLAANASSRSAG
jgi:hypothetical protein